jgi:hypothetical protein
VHENYSEKTKETGDLKICLEEVQAAQSAAKGETSAVRAQLAAADARVAGKFSLTREKPSSKCSVNDPREKPS